MFGGNVPLSLYTEDHQTAAENSSFQSFYKTRVTTYSKLLPPSFLPSREDMDHYPVSITHYSRHQLLSVYTHSHTHKQTHTASVRLHKMK